MLWNNTSVKNEFITLYTVLQTIKNPAAWLSDLIRYHALEKYGGIYLDTDIIPVGLGSLEDLLKLRQFTVCEHPWDVPPEQGSDRVDMVEKNCELAGNAVIGATPHHIALQEAIQSATKNTLKQLHNHQDDPSFKYNMYITGPPVWFEVAKDNNVTILKAFTFYPCLYFQKCIPDRYQNYTNIFAMHMWENSWG